MARPATSLVALVALLGLAACGSGTSTAPVPSSPFVAELPDDTPGGGGALPSLPPPTHGLAPRFEADAFAHTRTAFYGSFPCDAVHYDTTVFTNDADEIEANGAWIVPVDVGGIAPRASSRYERVRVLARYLVDSNGQQAGTSGPIGFGWFLNDIEIASERVGFVLVNAGGSDSAPTLSNVVVFDPTKGDVLQVVNLANVVSSGPRLDSTGNAVAGGRFRQAGAEALAYVPKSSTRGLLYVAMTNLVFAAPSYGAVKLPGTVQVYDVDLESAQPVQPRSQKAHVTQTLFPYGHNPVAIQRIVASGGAPRLLVTVAGTTAVDESQALVPSSPASVQAYGALTGQHLGTFELGLVGLSGARPALGQDQVGHRIGFFPSSVTGEIYLLRLDGLYDWEVDVDRLAVLRGELNGIPIASEDAGAPGGNITSVGLVAGGRALAVAGFGDLFAYPTARPGRLYLLALPPNVVTGSGFGTNFVPGATLLETIAGRTIGAMVVDGTAPGRPDLYVTVGGALDSATYLGSGPGSLGALWLNDILGER